MAIAAPCNCRLILFEEDYLQCIQWSENWKSQIFFKRMNPHTNSDMQGHRFSMQIFSGPVLPTLRFFVWLWMSSCGRPKIFQRSCLWKNEDIVDDDNDTNFALSDHLATLETPFPFITPNDFELSTWCCTTTGKQGLNWQWWLFYATHKPGCCLSLLKILQFQQEFHLVFSTRLRGLLEIFTDACTLCLEEERKKGVFYLRIEH